MYIHIYIALYTVPIVTIYSVKYVRAMQQRGGGICSPPLTLKSRWTTYVLVPPRTFTTTFILID